MNGKKSFLDTLMREPFARVFLRFVFPFGLNGVWQPPAENEVAVVNRHRIIGTGVTQIAEHDFTTKDIEGKRIERKVRP